MSIPILGIVGTAIAVHSYLFRGTVAYRVDYGRLPQEDQDILLKRPKSVIFFTESNLIRGVYSYYIDANSKTLTLNFVPERWVPRMRPELNPTNIEIALREAILRAKKRDESRIIGL